MVQTHYLLISGENWKINKGLRASFRTPGLGLDKIGATCINTSYDRTKFDDGPSTLAEEDVWWVRQGNLNFARSKFPLSMWLSVVNNQSRKSLFFAYLQIHNYFYCSYLFTVAEPFVHSTSWVLSLHFAHIFRADSNFLIKFGSSYPSFKIQ